MFAKRPREGRWQQQLPLLAAVAVALLLAAPHAAPVAATRGSISVTRALLQATDGGSSDTTTGGSDMTTGGSIGTTGGTSDNTTTTTTTPTTTTTAPTTTTTGGTAAPPAVTSAGATLPGDIAAVRSCLPFNILILPGPAGGGAGAGGSVAADMNATDNTTSTTMATGGGGGNATLYMTAELAVINATDITYSQEDGILSLGLTQGYTTSHVINLTIVTANSSSLRFVQNFGPGNLVVGPGFNVDTFSAAATSLGGILVIGLTTGHAYVTNTGLGTVALDGNFGDTDVVSGGTAKIYLAGNASGTVAVQADGISTVWVKGTPDTKITGTANGLAKVLYNEGTCSVKPAFLSIFGISPFGDPCQKAPSAAAPTFNARWSCGQVVYGQSICPEVQVSGASGIGLGGGGGPTGSAAGTTAGSPTGTEPTGSTAAPNVNTVSGEPGTVTTGTFTTPGGTASSSGTVSGPSGTLGSQQSSTGGSPPLFAASAFPPTPDFFSPTLGSGLEPDFMANPFGSMGTTSGGVGLTGMTGGGSAMSSSSSSSGGGPVTAISSSSGSGPQQSLSSALNIPSLGSGLSITSTSCADPDSSRDMFPSGGSGTSGP